MRENKLTPRTVLAPEIVTPPVLPAHDIPMLEENRAEYEGRVEEFLTRAVEAVYPSREELQAALMSGEQMTAYLGVDPTGPDMHIGHESQLHKLRRLQEMGHKIILLVGDFTAMIGDPSDKTAARKRLSFEQVHENAQSYRDQASKILNFDDPNNPVDMRFNSEWLGEMSFADVVDLAAEFTVQQIGQRDMFQRRTAEGKPTYLHEFLYPLMQGWDSVAMNVDIEVGGNDQTFNMMVGRDLMKRYRSKNKFVVAGKMLVDPKGTKMGKSEGNMITMGDDPDAMFRKVMQWGDGMVPSALELCTTVSMDEIADISQRMNDGSLDGHTAKMMLGRTLVTELHSSDDAKNAQESYERILTGELNEDEITEFQISTGQSVVDVLVASGLASSKRDARTLISQGGVRLDGVVLDDIDLIVDAPETVLRVGKGNKIRRIVTTSQLIVYNE